MLSQRTRRLLDQLKEGTSPVARTSEFDYKWGGWEGLGGLGSPEHVTVLIWKDFDIAQCHFQFLIVKVLTGFEE